MTLITKTRMTTSTCSSTSHPIVVLIVVLCCCYGSYPDVLKGLGLVGALNSLVNYMSNTN
jgi:hypothetical protein